MNYSLALLLLSVALLVMPGARVKDIALARLSRLLPPRQLDKARHSKLVRSPIFRWGALISLGVGVIAGWPRGLILCILGLALAGALTIYLGRRATSDVPDPLRLAATWDLLAACLRSGLPVPTAVDAVAQSAPTSVAASLRTAAGLLSLGATPEKAWEAAGKCSATAEFARAAQRTARSGIALAEASAELAARARSEQSDVMEARAGRASVWIAGPLTACFLPAFLCLGIVPVMLGLASQLDVVG